MLSYRFNVMLSDDCFQNSGILGTYEDVDELLFAGVWLHISVLPRFVPMPAKLKLGCSCWFFVSKVKS